MAHVNHQFTDNVYDSADTNGSVNIQPPKYDEVFKTPYVITSSNIPPPQYVHTEPQLQTQPESSEIEIRKLKYEKLHKIHGILSIVFGGFVIILDPLLPTLFDYYYSSFPPGVFMVISGICSIHGSRKRNKCCLVASLVFNILTIILLFTAYILGLVAAGYPRVSVKCISYYCVQNENFYLNGVQGLGVFNTIWGMFLFVLMLWDSTLKCGTVCCKKRQHNPVIYNPNNSMVNPIIIMPNLNNS